jgi:hypothetical protein
MADDDGGKIIISLDLVPPARPAANSRPWLILFLAETFLFHAGKINRSTATAPWGVHPMWLFSDVEILSRM